MARPFQDGVPGGMFGEGTMRGPFGRTVLAASTESCGALVSLGVGSGVPGLTGVGFPCSGLARVVLGGQVLSEFPGPFRRCLLRPAHEKSLLSTRFTVLSWSSPCLHLAIKPIG